MTTDPTPLHERIVRALWDHDNAHMTPEWRDMAWNDMGGGEPAEERVAYELRAAAILPLIAAEVRKAQGEAWTDCVSEASALGWLHAPAALDMLDRNPHETED